MLPQSLATIVAAALFVTGTAVADELVVSPDRDNTLYEDTAGSLSNGAGAYLFTGRTNQGAGNDIRRALLRFDVSGIPAGSTINSVSLTLWVSRSNEAGTTNVTAHRVTADWGEGASNASGQEGAGDDAETGDATWLHRFFDTTLWASAGGDYVGAASATTSVGAADNFYTWSGAGLEADVLGWVNGGPNHGWIVIGDESEGATAKRFNSRENNSSETWPSLTVNFTPPGSTGACCFDDGTCQVQTSTDCAINGGIYQGDGVPCNPCPPAGACCIGETCQFLTATACGNAGGVYQGDGVPCDPNPCSTATGACCLDAGECQELTLTACTTAGGDFQGEGTTCDPNPCPVTLEPFLDPLPIPAVIMPVGTDPDGVPRYEVPITQFQQQLHAQLPPTTCWGYGGTYPGPTFVVSEGNPIRVVWINDLRDEMGNLRTDHYMPVDLCPHGAANEAKVVTHLHGGVVPPEADGYPEETFLPGHQEIYDYPNVQRAATIWYHDHALGITRLNVIMGMAGFYIVTDAAEAALNLPSGEFDIGLAIQDRSFNADGSFDYPAVWQDHFFGDKALVNGKVWPFLEVKRARYRLRLLNGSTSRLWTLVIEDENEVRQTFNQIGTDAGLLPAPVPLTQITLASGERADIIMDFGAYSNNTDLFLENIADPTVPGAPDIDEVMKFTVRNPSENSGDLPATLIPIDPIPVSEAVITRDMELRKFGDDCASAIWLINGLKWDDITEYPQLDEVEIWRFINRSGQPHPMHMHLVHFQILDRQGFEVIGGEVVPIGMPQPPDPTEAGWKDTVRVDPQEIVRVIARFEPYTGKYPYHCHILEHEDHEMMRQFWVIESCPADTNRDGTVNVDDLNAVILDWGTDGSANNGDITGPLPGDPPDGIVNVNDLNAVIVTWGSCL